MSIPYPRPGTHWNKQQMLSIFTFIEESNPSFNEIEDVALLQVGIKQDTFLGYWETWINKGYIYKDESKNWVIKEGLIDMIKSGLPTKFGGSREQEEPEKIEKTPEQKYEDYKVRMAKKGAETRVKTYEEWTTFNNKIKEEVEKKNE